MKRISWKSCLRPLLAAFLFAAAFAFLLPAAAKEVYAAKTGFTTINGKSYYIDADGSRHKGWLTLNGKRYYFNKKTGVQLKGWGRDGQGRKMRYFTKGQGYMVTGYLTDSKNHTRYFDPKTGILVRGWMTDSQGYKYYFTSGEGVMAKGWLENSKGQLRYFSKTNGRMLTGFQVDTNGNTRYFNPKNGIMATGLKKIGDYYFYFDKSNGVRCQKGFTTVGSNTYYFSPKNGRAQTGWLTLDGEKYYFSAKGVMYVSRTATIDGKTYSFDKNGVASESQYVVEGDTVKVYDAKNDRTYTLLKEFIEHPGVATGEVTDLDLLAALCECEAGNQGKVGMMAVAMAALNRTIREDKAFPSELRYVLYQGTSRVPQFGIVNNGNLLKRLNGQYINRTLAYEAASEALEIFNDHVRKGTPRKLPGFDREDFNFMFFMTKNAFWSQSLNHDKVDYYIYKDHVFFVNWA